MRRIINKEESGSPQEGRRTPTPSLICLHTENRNPFCKSCVKAKMRHFRSRTGAFKREVKTFERQSAGEMTRGREVKTFGDLVTFDFVTVSGDHEVERGSRSSSGTYIPELSWPIQPREETLTPSSTSAGKIKQVHLDDGPELRNACVEPKLNHDQSLGRPQNNSLLKGQINS